MFISSYKNHFLCLCCSGFTGFSGDPAEPAAGPGRVLAPAARYENGTEKPCKPGL